MVASFKSNVSWSNNNTCFLTDSMGEDFLCFMQKQILYWDITRDEASVHGTAFVYPTEKNKNSLLFRGQFGRHILR